MQFTGKLIAYQSGTGIYENVLDHLKSAGNAESKVLRMILKKYHPDNKSSTLDTKICVYALYMKQNQGESNMEICNGKIKVNAFLHSMEAGEATKLEYEGRVFVWEKQSDVLEQASLAATEIMVKSKVPLDKGKHIFSYGHNKGYENILNDVKALISSGKDTPAADKKLMKRYYPKGKTSSLKAYVSFYKRYIRDKIQGKEIKPKRSYKKRRPTGTLGYNKNYHINIQEEDVQTVMKALKHVAYNYKTNSKTLQKTTGLQHGRLMGTLSWLVHQGKVKKTKTPTRDVLYTAV